MFRCCIVQDSNKVIQVTALENPAMSALGPIDPSSVQTEDQKQAAWIVRKLAGVNNFNSRLLFGTITTNNS